MPRVSIETTKAVIASLVEEQKRDRETLLRMLAHTEKMIGHLLLLRDSEETRVENEAIERKDAVRKMFDQLIAVEEERKLYIALQVADIDGPNVMAEAAAVAPPKPTKTAAPAKSNVQPLKPAVKKARKPAVAEERPAEIAKPLPAGINGHNVTELPVPVATLPVDQELALAARAKGISSAREAAIAFWSAA